LKVSLVYFLIFLCPYLARSQDTVFVSKHQFSTPVRNVFAFNDALYVKTGEGLYKLEGEKWVLQQMKFTKTYVFFDKGFFEADYLLNKYLYNADPISYLIPQKSITSATKADLGDRLFISAGGSLFEYAVNNNYRHYYEGVSIRDIFLEDGFRVISTYSGIFVNDTLKKGEPGYSNGYLRKIRNKYFLSADHLYEIVPPAEFRKIPSGVNVFAGYSRKLVEYSNNIYSLNTKSFNLADSSFNLLPIQQGYEYYDMELVGDKLLFCTQTGEVFMYDGQKVQQLVKLRTRIRDIYQFKNTVYLSSDEGVHTIEGLDANTLRLFANTPFAVMVLVDALRNTWISTENGMFLLPDLKKELIPYIDGVEFNRGALTLYNDTVYAGSITGLYVIDCYHVVKSFLPVYFNKIKADKTEQIKKWALYGTGLIILLAGLGFGYQAYKRKKARFIVPQKEEAPSLTIDQIAEAIRTHNIMTVEGLAEFYKTNTVQLNRQFKTFDTTPGKFMKTVKINYARELLKNKVPMAEVSAKLGYSASFIKKELKEMGFNPGRSSTNH
jgi:AraC-like DNA-binding protein